MAEPTLLQQARQFANLCAAQADRIGEAATRHGAQIAALHNAVDRMLQHHEQCHADASGPARAAGEQRAGQGERCVACNLGHYTFQPRTKQVECSHCGCNEDLLEDATQCIEAYHHGEELLDVVVAVERCVLYLRLLRVRKTRAASRFETSRTTPSACSDASDLDLDALQRLCDAATPGPWRMERDGSVRAHGAEQSVFDAGQPNADAAFIAAARDALPKLIAEVRRLRWAELTALMAAGKANDRAYLAECRLQDIESRQFVARNGAVEVDDA